MVDGVTASASVGNYAVTPGQAIALTANKSVTWTTSAASVTLRSTTSGATQWSSQVVNPAAAPAAFSVTATAGTEAVTLNFALMPGDSRNGRYVMFGTDMVRYALTVNFDVNEYSIVSDTVAPGAAVASGTFSTNPSSSGEYLFDVAVAPGLNNTARFRAGADAIVGSYPFPGLATATSFVAARKFARSAADFPDNVDLQIFSREEASSGGSINSSLYTARYNGSVLSLCIHPGITVIDACPVALIVYDLTFNSDESIGYVARPPTVEEGNLHVARIGSSWVHLRASANASGLKRFRIGIPLQATLDATAQGGDTRGNWGTAAASSTSITFNGIAPAGGSDFGVGSVIDTGTSYPPGLFLYRTTGNDQYFIGQSPELMVVNGTRNFTNPFVNGYLAVGLRP